MSGAAREPWDSGKIVKRSLKARNFRKVDRREVREVEIEVVRAPLVKGPPPSAETELPPPPTIERAASVAAREFVRQTPPQTLTPLGSVGGGTAGQALAPTAAAAIPFAVATGALAESSRAMRGEGTVLVRDTHSAPRGAETQTLPSSAHAASHRNDGGAVHGAMLTLSDGIYREVGQAGSILQTPKGVAFSVRRDLAAGEVHSQRSLTVPLPGGHTTSHPAAIAIELENGAHLVLDILPSSASLTEIKAHGFDALQFRRNARCFTVLVLVRVAGPGIAQEQVEAIAHGYDLVFGVDEEHARSDARYAALRGRVTAWLSAASKA